MERDPAPAVPAHSLPASPPRTKAPPVPSSPYVLPLHAVTRADAGRVGTKAAYLGDLACAGFPVPEGFILTVAAWDRVMAASASHGPAMGEAHLAGGVRLPDDLGAALRAAAAPFGAAPLAVRSSSLAEDIAACLVCRAIRDRPRYMWSRCPAGGRAALLVRHQVCACPGLRAYRRPGRAQGARSRVAHPAPRPCRGGRSCVPADPLSGDRSVVLVSAVRGRGERLVSGRSLPDEWLVRGDAARCRQAAEHAIDASQARAVCRLARQVEAHFGLPQDLEWALAGGRLYVLQARPITALPRHVPAAPRRGRPRTRTSAPPAGFWQREASHYPQPLSPMTRSTLLRCQNAGLRRVFRDMSLPMDGLELREIGGWVYLRRVWLGDRPLPPAWLMPLLIRLVPPVRARVANCARAMREDRAGAYIQRWETPWRGVLVARMSALRAVDLAPLPDGALDAHLRELLTLMAEATDIHFFLHAGLCFALADLVFTCRDLFGWDDARSMELLSGLSETSSAPARGLADLARMVRERPNLAVFLQTIDERTAGLLAKVDGDFAAAFAAYQEAYGYRTLRYEVAEPTLAERPALTLALIRDQIARGYDPAARSAALGQRRETAITAARTLLARRTPAQRRRFERALAAAARAYPVREESAFYTVGVLLALLRHALLEVGGRLARRSQIGERDDVFFLQLPEARRLLRGDGDGRPLVVQRRRERQDALAHPGPPSHGRESGPPPLGALPPAARLAMSALLFTVDRILAIDQTGRAREQGVDAGLVGIGAAPGVYTGPVRIIHSEAHFDRLAPGDILVCPIPSPMWSVLFGSIGALVTDTGGILSHAAIIARESGVPAVLATGTATRVLRDGQIVTVDGGSGTVRVTAPLACPTRPSVRVGPRDPGSPACADRAGQLAGGTAHQAALDLAHVIAQGHGAAQRAVDAASRRACQQGLAQVGRAPAGEHGIGAPHMGQKMGVAAPETRQPPACIVCGHPTCDNPAGRRGVMRLNADKGVAAGQQAVDGATAQAGRERAERMGRQAQTPLRHDGVDGRFDRLVHAVERTFYEEC